MRNEEEIDNARRDTVQEWHDLGFYYELDNEKKRWLLLGSLQGLNNFPKIIREYCADPDSEMLSEHDHFRPYMYLEIGTWSEIVIDDHWIAGPLTDLLRRANEAEKHLSAANIGDTISLRDAFAPNAEYDITLQIMDDDFDPASPDEMDLLTRLHSEADPKLG